MFHLEQPTGDLLYRLSMPATAAIPQEVAKCFTQGRRLRSVRDLVGPYMIMGEDQLDISSCSSMKPISGYNPDKGVTFVRNPNFKDDSESPDIRGNYLDGIQIAIDSNVDDIFAARSRPGDARRVLRRHTAVHRGADSTPRTPTLKASACTRTRRTGPGTSRMNLLAPPFDDIHVRKAVNYVMDKAAHGEGVRWIAPRAFLPRRSSRRRSTRRRRTTTPTRSANNAGDVHEGTCGDEAVQVRSTTARASAPTRRARASSSSAARRRRGRTWTRSR